MSPKSSRVLAEFRRRAESYLDRLVRHDPNSVPKDIEILVHELRVHQIELEMQNQELQRAQLEAEESRDRYRELYESIPIGYATVDAQGRMYDLNPEGASLLHEAVTPPRNFLSFIQDRDVDGVAMFLKHAVARQELSTCERQMRASDGTPFLAALHAVPVTIGEGNGQRLRVAFQDIGVRKEAEERLHRQQRELESNRAELLELNEKLFTVQETERKRIARELHDDHCQRVTALVLEANLLAKTCRERSPDLASRITSMSGKLMDILKDLRALSHDLLPRNLGDISLLIPIRGLIEEYNGKAQFTVEFEERDVPNELPPAVMTALFRLLQESLSNVTKHANAQRVTVSLKGTEQGIELVVADDGVGFEPTLVPSGRKSVGIIGMKERVRPLGGTVTISSQPGQGTRVTFSIPVRGQA